MQIKRIWQHLNLVVSMLVLLTSSKSVHAQSSVIITANAGYDQNYKEYTWVPIRLGIENTGETIDGWVEVVTTDGNGSDTTTIQTLNLPAGARKQLTLNVFLSTFTRELKISFLSANEVVSSAIVRLNPLSNSDQLYGVLSDHPTPYNLLAELDPPNGNAVVAPLNIYDLPEQAASWDSLDVLIISDVDTGQLSPGQRAALEQWLHKGRHLVVVAGAQWQRTIPGVIDLLPCTPKDTSTLSSLDELVVFSQSDQPLVSPNTFVITSSTCNPEAQISIDQENTPLLVRQKVGYGRVDYLAVDPGIEPLRSWDGLIELYRNIFTPRPVSPAWNTGVINWDAAREAAGTLPSITLPNTLSILCFLGSYVLILGPLNYYLLRKYKKREWAWITIPGIVLIFSLAAILVGSLSRGTRPILNRMAIIQAWPANGTAAISGVAGIYSPRPVTLDVMVGENNLVHTSPTTYGDASPDIRVQTGYAGSTIPGVRVAAGDTIPLVFDGSLTSPDIKSYLNLFIDGTGVRLQGSLVNNSQITYTDTTLLYPGGNLVIGEFAPGQTETVDAQLTQAQYLEGTQMQDTGFYSGAYAPYSGIYYYGMQDTTISDIIGSTDYYNDLGDYRRFMLLNTHLRNNQNPGRGWGVYLTGWVDAFPAEITLAEQPARLEDTSLYIFSLQPMVRVSGETWVLSPGVFTYSMLDENPYSLNGPYQFYIYPAESYEWAYSLAYPLAYSRVDRLKINLTAAQTTPFPPGLDIYLWDVQLDGWIEQDIGHWGSYSVPQPSRYISANNAVLLRLHNTGADSVYIEKADITLQVTP